VQCDNVIFTSASEVYQREFAVFAVVWNRLPLELRMLSCSVQPFAQRLKKHLFIGCYERIYFALYKCIRYYNYFIITSKLRTEYELRIR